MPVAFFNDVECPRVAQDMHISNLLYRDRWLNSSGSAYTRREARGVY